MKQIHVCNLNQKRELVGRHHIFKDWQTLNYQLNDFIDSSWDDLYIHIPPFQQKTGGQILFRIQEEWGNNFKLNRKWAA